VHVHHEEHGEPGLPPIVLVHGWGLESRRTWMDTGWVDALTPIRRVVLVDVRGHGGSEKPHVQAAYRYRAMAEDVLQAMDELSIESADYLGYSLGAFVGAALLGDGQADRVRSMVLGGIGDETEESAGACTAIAAALRAEDPAAITDPIGRAYRAFVDLDPTNDREALALAALEMWPDGHPLGLGGTELGAVDLPVLVVNGSDDHPYIDTVAPFVEALPRGELVVIPGADHLTAVTHPAFRSSVEAFLDRSGP
jgi:non-heme chloroperoxidase